MNDEPATTDQKVRAPCRACRNDTNHVVIRSVETQSSDKDSGVHWWSTYQIIQCLGCEGLSFRSVSGDSEDVDPQTGQSVESYEFYPSRTQGRAPVAGVNALPRQLERVYTETINALNRGQPVLCGIGVRAVVETVVKDQKAKGANLSKQIDNLVAAGVLTKEGALILHKLRVLGNKAAHDVKAHRPKELALAIDVVDHLLAAVYILPQQARRIFK